MEFDNSFTVRAPLSLVWHFMLDAQEVAPCVPGAQLTEMVDETHHKGTMKVKLGAVQMTYRGELEMQPDEANHTITLQAKGTETRGSGGASGTFTTRLSEPEDGVTHVQIHTKVDVTGRVAQFGRGIMQDVANRLIKDFASCLEQKLAARAQPQEETAEQAPTTSESQTTTGPATPQPAPAAAAVTATSPPPTPATVSPPPPRPPAPSASAQGNELRLQDLLIEIARSRLAAGLRALAALIEPK